APSRGDWKRARKFRSSWRKRASSRAQGWRCSETVGSRLRGNERRGHKAAYSQPKTALTADGGRRVTRILVHSSARPLAFHRKHAWKNQAKHRSFRAGRRKHDIAAMRAHQVAGDGEAEAGAAPLSGPGKRAKQ